MSTADAILNELKSLGNESTRKVFLKHGAREPFFGVKVEDLKKIQKRVKKDYELALALYETGNSDAMYLAGLIADDRRMRREDLEAWVNGAYWYMISEYTVPWVASGSPHGHALALEWIESDREMVATAGWATLSSLVATQPDESLNLEELKQLLKRVGETIHRQPNRVRYTMNGFVASVGGYCKPLTALALETAGKIGKVSVDMGETACNVPDAADRIGKIEARGSLGKKRKSAKC
ncbi:MAG: DNA alkylation repair protein [Armatimonadetes bacterium]|nr:DNA alkylation repair protein [Armatimonadota bacterium]